MKLYPVHGKQMGSYKLTNNLIRIISIDFSSAFLLAFTKQFLIIIVLQGRTPDVAQAVKCLKCEVT